MMMCVVEIAEMVVLMMYVEVRQFEVIVKVTWAKFVVLTVIVTMEEVTDCGEVRGVDSNGASQ